MGGHAPFYVKHKALANLNSYVTFLPVEIHLQLFTTVIITTVICTGGGVTKVQGQLPRASSAYARVQPHFVPCLSCGGATFTNMMDHT